MSNNVEPGSPPIDIRYSIELDNRVTFSWRPPLIANGVITVIDHFHTVSSTFIHFQGYTIYISDDRQRPLINWLTHQLPAAETTFQLIRGTLKPITRYYLRISANTTDGEGVISNATEFTTLTGGMCM